MCEECEEITGTLEVQTPQPKKAAPERPVDPDEARGKPRFPF